MGMFDRVMVECPWCSQSHEAQSKSGPCNLGQYTMRDVPTSVIPGVLGVERCEHCDRPFEIREVSRPVLEVVKWGGWE